jgi:hypothetical protein
MEIIMKQKTNYYYSPDGTFGRYYSNGNVKPYGSVWKVTTYTNRNYATGKHTEWESAPECIYANVTGMDDPCIRKHVRDNLILPGRDERYY